VRLGEVMAKGRLPVPIATDESTGLQVAKAKTDTDKVLEFLDAQDSIAGEGRLAVRALVRGDLHGGELKGRGV